jgi:hypothetical protein
MYSLPNIPFPARININCPIPSDVDAVVRSINSRLLDDGFTDVDFSDDSPHLPHVTLLMGEVPSRSALEALLERCQHFAQSQSQFAYSLGPPYWKKPSLKFLFLDTLPLERFRRFRVDLLSELGGLIHCEFHGGPENPSHITAGYGDSRRLPSERLMPMYRRVDGIATHIRICEAGERGTCHSPIAEFALAASAS